MLGYIKAYLVIVLVYSVVISKFTLFCIYLPRKLIRLLSFCYRKRKQFVVNLKCKLTILLLDKVILPHL
uniref:Putative secreted protein n=1 Tax=Anopheles darlingi TaxID=43151 RepID=A0A2M4DF38_ANODA